MTEPLPEAADRESLTSALRRRVETRTSEVPGLIVPDWREVSERDDHPWDRDRLMIDTAGQSVAHCVELVFAAL
jgi:hypothetical protein